MRIALLIFGNYLAWVKTLQTGELLGEGMQALVHLLMSVSQKTDPSKVLQALKQKVSRELHHKGMKSNPAELRAGFSESTADEAAFWQRRFHDFNVWSEEKLAERLKYMHATR